MVRTGADERVAARNAETNVSWQTNRGTLQALIGRSLMRNFTINEHRER